MTGLDGVRERPQSGVEAVEPGEVVTRLSEAWRRAFDAEHVEGVDEAD